MDPKPPTRLATTAYVVVTALLVGFLATGVILTATTIIGAVRGDQTITQDRFVAPDALTSLPANIKPTNDIPVTVTITNARPDQLLLHLAITLVPGLLLVALLWQLWGLLRTARQGDPFTGANVWRLRQFGWLLLLGWPLVAYLTMALKELLAATWATPTGAPTSGTFAPPIGGALLFGLAVLVLAEVFAHGLRLREDVEGTI